MSSNDLLPVQWKAIASINADLLPIEPLGAHFSEI